MIIICGLLTSSLQAQTNDNALQTVTLSLSLGDSINITALSGSLSVPENRLNAESRNIKLDFVVMRGLSAKYASINTHQACLTLFPNKTLYRS